MGFLDAIFKRNSELSFMFDTEFFVSASTRIHMKHLAVETCANFLARTISQSEFRVKTNGAYDDMMRWYTNNVFVKETNVGKIFLKKEAVKRKTDGFQALVHAMYRAKELDEQSAFVLDDIDF